MDEATDVSAGDPTVTVSLKCLPPLLSCCDGCECRGSDSLKCLPPLLSCCDGCERRGSDSLFWALSAFSRTRSACSIHQCSHDPSRCTRLPRSRLTLTRSRRCELYGRQQPGDHAWASKRQANCSTPDGPRLGQAACCGMLQRSAAELLRCHARSTPGSSLASPCNLWRS